jgi:hypothetical protein
MHWHSESFGWASCGIRSHTRDYVTTVIFWPRIGEQATFHDVPSLQVVGKNWVRLPAMEIAELTGLFVKNRCADDCTMS